MSNSVSECIRAVFAAFIWHEGILHDAMASASYLKFNSNLPKKKIKLSKQFLSSKINYRQSSNSRPKTKFRHSVEVSQLSALQQECFKNGNIEFKKELSEDESSTFLTSLNEDTFNLRSEQDQKSQSDLIEEKNIPQTLVYLLILWEEISQACLMYIAQPPPTLTTPINENLRNVPSQSFNRIKYLKDNNSDSASIQRFQPSVSRFFSPLNAREKNLEIKKIITKSAILISWVKIYHNC